MNRQIGDTKMSSNLIRAQDKRRGVYILKKIEEILKMNNGEIADLRAEYLILSPHKWNQSGNYT